jgi:hypothetical protein
MSEKARLYHIVFDQQNIERLRKMVNQVAHDPNGWIDVTCRPGSDEPGKESPPTLEFAEMLWDEAISRAVIARSVKYEAQALE